MIGNNKLYLNKAEINKAIEYYLNTIVLKQACSVTSVEYNSNMDNGVFIVLVTPAKDVSVEHSNTTVEKQ